MPTPLEIANELLKNEEANQSLYRQLLEAVTAPKYVRAVESLRTLQTRQLSILNNLIDDLADEEIPPPEERFYAQHVLQPGETLQMLATMYNTTVARIRQLNPRLPATPQAGQVINLPIEIPRPPAGSLRYHVQRSDTLFHIAQKYGTDVATLVRLNNIADPDVIFPGRILIIPRPR
ncbi:LysM peptidoglycan-binding domain-containing protein [Halonatronum saccharophilum]|uniref:LysM peptidoglycan-binding domain-containing protein n=1 Tax=Halonatronum saccharophilum TaxID=150060 RepID=UPI0004820804|nr:LysM peptidoglycan-binding domain-containing protein [Halonatronum saccharophilum]